LDGELYVHGEEFQELIHLIKRDEPHPDSKKIEYHIYDMIDLDKDKLSFSERTVRIKTLAEKAGALNKVVLVTTNVINNETAMKKAQDWAEKNGYEGIMLRNCGAPYKIGHRSHDLLKVKQFQDAEFKIVGAYENKGKQEGQCTIECVTDEGTKFGVKPEGTDEQRRWYWKHKDEIIGKKLTVRFFSWTTSEHPVPRFPIGVSIRDYE
jgi:DNA ligase-1